jgi:hypothetical protein
MESQDLGGSQISGSGSQKTKGNLFILEWKNPKNRFSKLPLFPYAKLNFC